ncbi:MULTISPECIES: hypothetical protein [Streptomyces]|uniref:hypothetical protein n=1 Tax=Streptomyces lycopersici TaxID=2974589 RepID=UPI0021D00813|nr:hypothetical protein [Streptomyces sp. NEAU-383]
MFGEAGGTGEAGGVQPPQAATETNVVRLNESGDIEFYDGERWVPYTDLTEDDPGPLGIVFREDGQ